MATLERREKSRPLAHIVAQFRTTMPVDANPDARHRARPMTLAHGDANEPALAAPGGAPSPPQVTFVTHRSNGRDDDFGAESAHVYAHTHGSRCPQRMAATTVPTRR